MKKILIILILFFPIQVLALTYPELHYKNAIVYDRTDDTILYEYNSETQTSIASLTKIMTTITAIENIENLDEHVTYTQEMASLVRWDASVSGLKVGDTITYRDLLYASILPSGADATTALALSISGSIDAYVTKMNDFANELNLANTHFVNVTGLDAEGHYSTAKDVLNLLNYALNNPIFQEIYTTKEYTLTNGLTVKSTIYAYSKGDSINTERIIGSKTGFTKEAGLCISALINAKEHDIIIVTIGAPSNGAKYNVLDALTLIEFLDNNYNNQTIVKKTDTIKEIPVQYSNISSYTVKPTQDILYYLPNDYNQEEIKIEYKGLEELSFKNKKDSKIGEVQYYYQDKLITTEDIYLKEDLKMDIIKIISHYKYCIFSILIFILFLLLLKKRVIKKLSK